MSNILIISGHPNLEHSTANRTILTALEKALPHAEIRRLDSLYPNYQFDIAAEQEAVLKADVIVWQFPVEWYHMPAILQKWLCDVFAYGFAYGTGAKLAGKKLIISCTFGGSEADYQHDGAQKYTVEELSYGYRSTAALCNLEFGGVIYSDGMMYIPGVSSEADLEVLKTKARQHAERLVECLKK